jgi:hypothetical protein
LADFDDVVDRLDRMLAILQLAHFEAIQRSSREIRKDPTNDAILEACSDGWVSSAAVRETVRGKTGAQDGTIKKKISELVARRALFERGSTTDRAYKSSNLV